MNPRAATTTEELARLYREHFAALVEIARTRFVIPSMVAEHLAHDVLLASLRQVGGVVDVRAWLVGALLCAGREYLAQNSGAPRHG